MGFKFYIFNRREDAQALADLFTQCWGNHTKYTEVRHSNNGKGYAVRADELTENWTDLEPQDLPQDFYLDDGV